MICVFVVCSRFELKFVVVLDFMWFTVCFIFAWNADRFFCSYSPSSRTFALHSLRAPIQHTHTHTHIHTPMLPTLWMPLNFMQTDVLTHPKYSYQTDIPIYSVFSIESFKMLENKNINDFAANFAIDPTVLVVAKFQIQTTLGNCPQFYSYTHRFIIINLRPKTP